MADDGWSRALMAASGVPVASERKDDGLRALVNEARADGLDRKRVIELAQHREPDVREAIAARPDCPLGMQASLAHDRRASVRVALASAPALAASIARALARDREVAVLKALARNGAVPHEVLLGLASHRRPDVARLARRTLDGVVIGQPAPARAEVQEIAEGRDRRTASPVAPASPVGDRASRVLAPRPSVARDMARDVPRDDARRQRHARG